MKLIPVHHPLFPVCSLGLALLLGGGFSLSAQTAIDPNEGLRLTNEDQSRAFSLSWFGASQRSYFIQHTNDLMSSWGYLPVIEQGADAPIEYGFSVVGAPPLLFFRLVVTDQSAPDPYLADFDADGIPNGWELEHGLDPILASDAATVSSGLTWLARYQQSTGTAADPLLARPLGLVVHTP